MTNESDTPQPDESPASKPRHITVYRDYITTSGLRESFLTAGASTSKTMLLVCDALKPDGECGTPPCAACQLLQSAQ